MITSTTIANAFIFCEPLAGQRYVSITELLLIGHIKSKNLLDNHYPTADKVRLVMDQLNTHNIGSLYKAFPPEVAQRLAKRLEIHHTPKHGSWLNIAEIELSCMDQTMSQGLYPRYPNPLLSNFCLVQTTQPRRCYSSTGNFSTDNARIRLKRLYPVFGD